MQITSVHNPRVKAAGKLRNARDRASQRRFIIDGVREIHRALDGKVQLLELYVCPQLADPAALASVEQRLRQAPIERFDVTSAVFEKLAYGDRSEGIVAVGQTPELALADITNALGNAARPALIVVLEGVEKPGNLGAVLRTADGAGATAVIVADSAGDLYNPNAIRASLGTIFTVPACRASSRDTLAWLRSHRLAIFAARVDGAVDYTACGFRDSCALVLGSEAAGLSDVWQADDITPIRVPMRGAADSLNVSATAAVLLYEAVRQRG